MELLDKTIPNPSDLATTAREAAARAAHLLEPLTDQLTGPLRGTRRSRVSRFGASAAKHPFAIGATVVVLAGIAYVALHSSGGEATDEATVSGPQRMRNAA